MPNWCANRLVFTGNEADKANLNKVIFDKEGYLSFTGLIPMPEDIMSADDIGNYPAWYSWSIDHWGTKWDACNSMVLDDGTIIFDTAWRQPDPWIHALVEYIEEEEIQIEFDYLYYEPGCAFAGEFSYTPTHGLCGREYSGKELRDVLRKEDGDNDLPIINDRHAVTLSMAVGHIHDMLFEQYGDHLHVVSTSGHVINVSNTVNPDGIRIYREDKDVTILTVNELNKSIMDAISTDIGIDHPDLYSIYHDIACLAVALDSIFTSHGLVPKDLTTYG